jgi:hypothetical protein
MAIIVGSIVFALAVLWGGNADYEEAVAEHRHYCIMVAAGYWPDYDQRDCGGVIPSDKDNGAEF